MQKFPDLQEIFRQFEAYNGFVDEDLVKKLLMAYELSSTVMKPEYSAPKL